MASAACIELTLRSESAPPLTLHADNIIDVKLHADASLDLLLIPHDIPLLLLES